MYTTSRITQQKSTAVSTNGQPNSQYISYQQSPSSLLSSAPTYSTNQNTTLLEFDTSNYMLNDTNLNMTFIDELSAAENNSYAQITIPNPYSPYVPQQFADQSRLQTNGISNIDAFQ